MGLVLLSGTPAERSANTLYDGVSFQAYSAGQTAGRSSGAILECFTLGRKKQRKKGRGELPPADAGFYRRTGRRCALFSGIF